MQQLVYLLSTNIVTDTKIFFFLSHTLLLQTLTIMPVVTISPVDWLELGLQMVGFDSGHQICHHKMDIQCFQAHFGASPPKDALCHTLRFLSTFNANCHGLHHQASPRTILHLLMATYGLKAYSLEAQTAAGTFKFSEDSPNKHLEVRLCHSSAQGSQGMQLSFIYQFYNGQCL